MISSISKIKNKKVRFFTIGCKVNQYETQSMREQLIKAGIKESSKGRADIYVINTCTVTSRADRKSINYIKKAIKENPKGLIVALGCLAEKDREEIESVGKVDIIATNKSKNNILKLILDKFNFSSGIDNLSCDNLISSFSGHSRAFIKVQDGCNNSCAYCKIPSVRGRSRSRSLAEITREAKALIQNGYKEIVLCGICLGCYGKDLKPKKALVDVISAIIKLKGNFRVRLSSIEARDITDRLIKLLASSDKICRHMHIPFQSGDDEILRLMQRKYTASFYKKIVDKLKEQIPDIAITTDILVGFPGEEDKHFLTTVELIEYVGPSRIHIFPFSLRKDTLAYDLPSRVSMNIIKERIEKLGIIARRSSYLYRKRFLNEKLYVLFEDKKDRKTGFAKGYTDNYIEVLCDNLNVTSSTLRPAEVFKVNPECTFVRV